jgi:hypothetical protein
MLLLSGLAATAAVAKDWKAVTVPPPTETPASFCSSLASLIDQHLEKARVIRATLKTSETGPSTSVFEMAQKMMGKPYEGDWEIEQKHQFEKAKAEAIELNERYKDDRCGSINIEQELTREPKKTDEYKPLTSTTKKTKF